MTGCEQREIKFRAWHKKKNKMYKVYRMCFADYQEGVFYYSKPYADGRSINAETGDQDIIIMQFTGLKDTNGKEIYEGDIIKRIAKRSCCGAVEYTIEGVVEWFCEGWVVRENGADIGDCAWANQKNETMEVIGNIYENPELLEQSGERTNP